MAQSLLIAMGLSNIFILWKALCLLASTSQPFFVVISGSMEPAFHRGDVLLLENRTEKVRVGDIPVVWFQGSPLPMVHRVVQTYSIFDS